MIKQNPPTCLEILNAASHIGNLQKHNPSPPMQFIVCTCATGNGDKLVFFLSLSHCCFVVHTNHSRSTFSQWINIIHPQHIGDENLDGLRLYVDLFTMETTVRKKSTKWLTELQKLGHRQNYPKRRNKYVTCISMISGSDWRSWN